MNTIYFCIYENRREHFPFYQITWTSLLAHANAAETRFVVPNCGSDGELVSAIPPPIEVINCHLPNAPIHRGTLADLAKWACSIEGTRDDVVLFLDSRDMIFQRDPIPDICAYDLVSSGEGVKHGACDFNTADQNAVMSYLPQALTEGHGHWDVVCFGVLAGKRWAARWALISAFMFGSTFTRGGTDQGAWNHLWNKYIKNDQNVWLADPNIHDWCLNGHHAAKIRPEPYWKDGQVICAATGRPYAMLHQWERTRWRDELYRRWTAKRVSIITPATRPQNLARMRESILTALAASQTWQARWYVVFDAQAVPDQPTLDNSDRLDIVRLATPSVLDGRRVSISGNAQRNLALDHITDGWVCFLDDDTYLHPVFLSHLESACTVNPRRNFIVDQSNPGGDIRLSAKPENTGVGSIDSGQVLLTKAAIGNTRWNTENYTADGYFISEIYQRSASQFSFVNLGLSIYNALR